MTIFTKDPASPEVVAALKQKGHTLVEVTCTRLYLLHETASPAILKALMQEWFVECRGRSHAYRDGSHIGGSDVVSQIKVLTEEGSLIALNVTTIKNRMKHHYILEFNRGHGWEEWCHGDQPAPWIIALWHRFRRLYQGDGWKCRVIVTL